MMKTYWTLHICLILMHVARLHALTSEIAESAMKNTANFLSNLLHIESNSEHTGNLYGINVILLQNQREEKKPESKQILPMPVGLGSIFGPPIDPVFTYDEEANSGLFRNNDDCNLGGQCGSVYFAQKNKRGLRRHNGLPKKPRYPEVLIRADIRKQIRRHNAGDGVVLRKPRYPEELPAAEPILPGHTLLRPAVGMLKSAVKYPLRDVDNSAVYGNLDNVGITWGKTANRIRYSDFRKHNDLITGMQNLIKNRKTKNSGRSRPMIVIELEPSELRTIKRGNSNFNIKKKILSDTPSNEILDDIDALFEQSNKDIVDLRRKKSKSRYRNHDKLYGRKKDDSDSKEESDDNERNPGNPYTIYKNKYIQNWLWNHEMDGDHMNINPHAPTMETSGPSGAELFFGRKWWYFNQDDYKPM